MKKIMLLLIALVSFLGLAGCQDAQRSKMPTIRGTEISINHIRLANMLERVNVEGKEEDIVYIKLDQSVDFVYDNEFLKLKYNQESYSDLMTWDQWINVKAKVEIEEGSYEIDFDSFSSNRYLYFSVKQTYDIITNDFYVKPVYDGKYYVERDMWDNNFESISIDVGAFQEVDGTSILFDELFESIIELSRYRYKGLKVYERENTLTISLKTNYDSYLEERNEIKDVFDEILDLQSLKDEHDEVEIIEFNLEYIGVIERNYYREAGIRFSFKIDIDGGEEHFYYTLTAYVNYNASLPNEIKYLEYERIQSIEEIIRY